MLMNNDSIGIKFCQFVSFSSKLKSKGRKDGRIRKSWLNLLLRSCDFEEILLLFIFVTVLKTRLSSDLVERNVWKKVVEIFREPSKTLVSSYLPVETREIFDLFKVGRKI